MRIIMVVLTSLTLGACNNPTKELEALAGRACECAEADTSCGNKVMADVTAFAQHAHSPGSSAFNQAGIKLNECLMQAGVKPRELTAALEKMEH